MDGAGEAPWSTACSGIRSRGLGVCCKTLVSGLVTKHINTHMWVHVCASMYVSICACTYVYMSVCTCVCERVHVSAYNM